MVEMSVFIYVDDGVPSLESIMLLLLDYMRLACPFTSIYVSQAILLSKHPLICLPYSLFIHQSLDGLDFLGLVRVC